MPHEVRALLWDMLDASQFILEDTNAVSFDEYSADRRLRQSVERSFEIIGEAARRLSIVDPGMAELISNFRQIVGFRNVIAHDYDEIQQPRVWEIVRDFLPEFRDEIDQLYRSTENS